MSKAGQTNSKRANPSEMKKFGWVVPAKRQPLFPPPPPAPKSLTTAKPGCAVSPEIATNRVIRKQAAAKSHYRGQRRNTFTRKTTAPQQRHGYFASAKRPIVSLYFVLPLILCYETAKIFVGGEQLSSGVDLWIHSFLCVLGVGQLVILPLLTTAVLLFHHHQSKDHWNIQPATFPKMAGEAIGFGFMLFFLANLFQIAAVASPTAGKLVDPYHWQIGSAPWWGHVVTYVGTGIHEELIFRVILMLPVIGLLKDAFEDKQTATLNAVIVIGLMFSLAHVDIVNPLGEPFSVTRFTFRFIASCVFSAIFLYRGFGIVVGTHIVYNVLTLIALKS